MRAYRADVAFDGEREIAGGAVVFVDGATIVGVEPGTAAAPDGCPVTYRPGTTLLPGLVDAHVHLCADSTPTALEQLPRLSEEQLDDIVAHSRQVELAAGVTTVRDLGDHEWTVVERHRNHPDGPNVLASGPPITSVGGHCAHMGGAVSGIEALRSAVAERAERGADAVKVMTSGGLTTGTEVLACQFTLRELRAVVEESHRLGLPVAAHAHALTAVEMCVEAGVDTIEHCSGMTAEGLRMPPELADRIAEAGIVVSPTMGTRLRGDPPPHIKALLERTGIRLEDRIPLVGVLIRAGVTIINGGDSGINPAKPHGLLPVSVAELVEAGMTPAQALASATSVATDAIGLGGRTGRLRRGMDADLVLVDGNPLQDIGALHDVRTVVSRGREVPTG
ncbi:MAG: amidohydrolase family protein [Actinomycetales bacterium]